MGQNITIWKVSVSFRIRSECGKVRTRKTPNTDTFHALYLSNICQILKNLSIPNCMNLSKPTALNERCTKNFAKFTGKYLYRSLFYNKVASLQCTTLLEKRSDTGVFLWILKRFKNTFFIEHLRVTAS